MYAMYYEVDSFTSSNRGLYTGLMGLHDDDDDYDDDDYDDYADDDVYFYK
jgi:hypothetical protein